MLCFTVEGAGMSAQQRVSRGQRPHGAYSTHSSENSGWARLMHRVYLRQSTRRSRWRATSNAKSPQQKSSAPTWAPTTRGPTEPRKVLASCAD